MVGLFWSQVNSSKKPTFLLLPSFIPFRHGESRGHEAEILSDCEVIKTRILFKLGGKPGQKQMTVSYYLLTNLVSDWYSAY